MEIAPGRRCHTKALGFVDPAGPGTFPATVTERKSLGFIRDLPKILTSFSEDVQVTQKGLSGTKPVPCSGLRHRVCRYTQRPSQGWAECVSVRPDVSSGGKDFLSPHSRRH